MVQWKLVCGFVAFFAVTTVNSSPIGLDQTLKDEVIYMDANFPGRGAQYSNLDPTAGTLAALHLSKKQRRLELTKSTDMLKIEKFFGLELETDITKLPTKCKHSPSPWPGSFWPTFCDSLNHKYSKKSESPAAKYAKAFGYDIKAFMDKISALKGVDSMKHREKCTKTAECKALNNTSVCAKRLGMKQGYCVPKWFGICHAWAPASILEAEPECAVEHNGVSFEPYDIKALLTLAYDGVKLPTIFTGTRFAGKDTAPNSTDQYGRFTDYRRRDISPGFFHIAITNIMCRFNSTFIIDIAAGNEVWNQPVHSYEILRLSWMTPKAVAKKYFKCDKYPFNDAATKIAVVTTRLRWVKEAGVNGPLVSTGIVEKYTASADYDYILETDETYHVLGGEWIAGSMKNHPDFMWFPASKPELSAITATGLNYSEVENLLIKSTGGNCKLASADKKNQTVAVDTSSSASSAELPELASSDSSTPLAEPTDDSSAHTITDADAPSAEPTGHSPEPASIESATSAELTDDLAESGASASLAESTDGSTERATIDPNVLPAEYTDEKPKPPLTKPSEAASPAAPTADFTALLNVPGSTATAVLTKPVSTIANPPPAPPVDAKTLPAPLEDVKTLPAPPEDVKAPAPPEDVKAPAPAPEGPVAEY
ncbi:unnamed protein product [Peronospora belbahrii]|uniref:Elicitor-like transglutaminase n=1 Tax=Peronospora belbahrii TaxID=622444 RepID=A0AAU9LE07_9STRA|nr:unnamed protein product [Peronospora belbahrii]